MSQRWARGARHTHGGSGVDEPGEGAGGGDGDTRVGGRTRGLQALGRGSVALCRVVHRQRGQVGDPRARERERGGTRARAGEESTSEGETRRHHWLALGRPRSPLEPRTRRGLVLDHAGSCSSLLLLVDLRAHARSAPRASSWTHVRPDFLSAELCWDSAGTGLPSLSASAPKDARGSRGKEVAHTPSGPRTSPASLSALAPLSSSTACVPLGSRSRALAISLPSASAPSLPP